MEVVLIFHALHFLHFYSCGSDRSSMFVALSILVQQLHTEKRVDIFTVTRKLRSQRHGMLQTFVSSDEIRN
jgi:protein tyrosine phosphatase